VPVEYEGTVEVAIAAAVVAFVDVDGRVDFDATNWQLVEGLRQAM